MTGLERKITTDFVHDFVRGMMTVAEYIERREFADAVQKIPEITPEIPVRDSGYIGKHEKNVSVYDAMMAEIHADKAIRAEKFRKTHDLCKKSKDDTPAERKRNKLNRLRKMYGDVFEDGREWYYENGKTGSKKSTEKDADIIRNLREASAESDAIRDYITDPVERNVGTATLQQKIDRKYAELQKAKADFCRDHKAHSAGDIYAVTDFGHFVLFYPENINRLVYELEKLEIEQKQRYQRKLDLGNKYLRKYAKEGWCY